MGDYNDVLNPKFYFCPFLYVVHYLVKVWVVKFDEDATAYKKLTKSHKADIQNVYKGNDGDGYAVLEKYLTPWSEFDSFGLYVRNADGLDIHQ